MADAGTLSVNVTARLDDLKSKFDTAVSQANSFANRMSTIGNKNYFAPMQETFKGMKRDLGQIVQGIILAQAFYQGIQLFKNLTAAVYEYTDALNYASVTFSNLFRDASLGEEFVAVLQQYSARSPFDFTDIERGARQLAAYGIQAKNLMYIMQGIGNLSAVTGDPQTFDTVSRAIGQIYAKGKLSAEEMRQLAEAGLNVKAVYERLGVDANTVAKANIDAGTAINAIIDTLNDSYAGAMNAANMTMRGMIGNVKDVLLSVVSAIYQPAYEKMQRVLLGFQQTLNNFQDTFQTEGLAAAIEKTFGTEALTRVQQVIAILQYLGNTIYQLLVPAFQILGMYGGAALSVIQSLVILIGPMLNVFAAFLHTMLSSAEGVRILQAALMGLAVMKIVGGFAGFLSGAMGILMTVVANTAKIATAASATLSALTAGEIASANGAILAGRAWTYFAKALNVNPIVLAITVVLALIAAIAGLRNILGKTTDVTAALGGDQWSDYFKNIKQGAGDLNKFNNALDKTESDVDDINDALDKTKKKQEGLLSFDEVFKIPETATSYNSGSAADEGVGEGAVPDLGDFELPEIEPLNFKDLLPDLSSLWDWIKNWIEQQPWETLANIITKGIASGIKAASKLPSKAAEKLIQDVAEVITKGADRFKIKDRIKKLAEDIKAGKTSWKEGGKELVDALTKEIEEQLGPEKARKLKVKEKLEKIMAEAEKGKEAWKKTGKKLVEELNEGIEKEILNSELKKAPTYKEKLEKLASKLEKADTKFGESGEKLAKKFYSELGKEFEKAGETVPEELRPKVEKALTDSIEPKNILKELKIKFSELDFKGILDLFLSKFKKAFTPARIVKFLKTSLKDMGITLIGEMLFDELANWLDENGETAAANAVENFGPIVASGLGTAIATRSPWGFVVGAVWGALFEALEKGLEEGDWTSMLAAIPATLGGMLGKAVSNGKFAKVFTKAIGSGKGSIWAMIGSIVTDLLFGSIADSMEDNGDKNGVAIVRGIGDCIAGALGGASIGMLFGPVGAIAGAIIGALVAALVGHWDEISAWWTNTAVPWFKELPSKIQKFFVDAGSWISEQGGKLIDGFLFGIKDVWKKVSTWFIDIPKNLKNFFTDAGKWLIEQGKSILNGLLTGIKNIYNSIKEWFLSIPSKIKGFFINADKWLSDPGKNIFAGFWAGLKQKWDGIATFFDGLFKTIIGFFTGDTELLRKAGYNIMDGLYKGITGVWKIITGFFTDILKNILAFFTGDDKWLTKDGKEILQGMLDGITTIWKNVSTWFTNLPKNIQEFFSKALTWLYENGKNVLQGMLDGIKNIWEFVSQWFVDLPGNIQDFFSKALNWLYEHGKNILQGMLDGIKNIWNDVYSWFINLPTNIKEFFDNAGKWLWDAGKSIIDGFFTGLKKGFESVAAWFGGIGDWIKKHKGPEEYDKNLLVDAGKWIMQGFQNGLKIGFVGIQNMVGGIGNVIQDKFTNASSWLWNAGANIISGLWDGLTAWFSGGDWNVLEWFASIKQRILNMFTYAADWLWNSGANIIKGLWDGLTAWFSGGNWNVLAWFKDLKQRILNMFTYAADWLWNAGWNVINGFFEGLKDRWSYVTGWVSDIGNWIAEHKGPEEYDKKLLIPAGNWIIGGLEEGMRDQFKNALAMVSSFGPQMEAAFTPPQLTVTRADVPSISSAPSASATQTVSNPYLNTSQNNYQEDISQRPIAYIGTLIADKQGLRELQKKLDIISAERNRYK